MKANRKFREENEAVSAVIGVILMVAITVAIAATVYVYVSGMLPSGGGTTPSVSWTVDAADNTITVTQGSTGNAYASATDSANLYFKSGGTSYYMMAYSDSTGYHVNASASTGYYTGDISAGDVLYFGTTGTYQVIWEPTNTVLGEVTIS